MFIAMNRFKVMPGAQSSFEEVWMKRDTYLREVPGFIAFHLLRGPEREDHTLYTSHAVRRSRDDFGLVQRSSGLLIAMQARTNHF
jgi:heme-degrading monooxygenase HmoA